MRKYHLGNQVGSGNFSCVFLGQREEDNEKVAIKLMKQHHNIGEKEASFLKQFDHPNIVRLLDFRYEADLNQTLLMLEYIAENTLELYQSQQHLNEEQTKCILFQTSLGLAYVHKRGVIHRDLKPENILIDKSVPIVKLIDFGLAVNANQVCTDYVATRWYRAPENLLGTREYGTAIDVFSLGCVIAQIYTGLPLFPGNNNIDQLYRIFAMLGEPSEKSWPIGHSKYIALGCKFNYSSSVSNIKKTSLKAFLSPCSEQLFLLLEKMLVLNPKHRITTTQIVLDPYFNLIQKIVPAQVYESFYRDHIFKKQSLETPLNQFSSTNIVDANLSLKSQKTKLQSFINSQRNNCQINTKQKLDDSFSAYNLPQQKIQQKSVQNFYISQIRSELQFIQINKTKQSQNVKKKQKQIYNFNQNEKQYVRNKMFKSEIRQQKQKKIQFQQNQTKKVKKKQQHCLPFAIVKLTKPKIAPQKQDKKTTINSILTQTKFQEINQRSPFKNGLIKQKKEQMTFKQYLQSPQKHLKQSVHKQFIPQNKKKIKSRQLLKQSPKAFFQQKSEKIQTIFNNSSNTSFLLNVKKKNSKYIGQQISIHKIKSSGELQKNEYKREYQQKKKYIENPLNQKIFSPMKQKNISPMVFKNQKKNYKKEQYKKKEFSNSIHQVNSEGSSFHKQFLRSPRIDIAKLNGEDKGYEKKKEKALPKSKSPQKMLNDNLESRKYWERFTYQLKPNQQIKKSNEAILSDRKTDSQKLKFCLSEKNFLNRNININLNLNFLHNKKNNKIQL